MKPLLVMLDEAQTIVKQRDFASVLLDARHRGIRFIMNFQNVSEAPVEVLGNCDALVAFRCMDARDRQTIARVARLTPEQSDALACLGKAECVCFMPNSGWHHAFKARVPELQFRPVSDAEMHAFSKATVVAWAWEPLQTNQAAPVAEGLGASDTPPGQARGGGTSRAGLDLKSERVLQDVLNQAHEFSPLTARFERAGIRSASEQGRILKLLAAAGLIRIWSLAVGKGRPIKLLEPTPKALEVCGIAWKARGRGTLRTRAATAFLGQKLLKLQAQGWTWVKEGSL